MGASWHIVRNVKVIGGDKMVRYVEGDGHRHWVPLRVFRSDSVCKIGDSGDLVVDQAWWLRHVRREANNRRRREEGR